MNKQPWDSSRVQRLYSAYWQSCTLHAAVSLGVLAKLSGEPCTLQELAGSLGLDPRGLGALLTALQALDLIKKEKDYYDLQPEAKPFFKPGGPTDMTNIILHLANIFPDWGNLSRCVQTGKPNGRERSNEELAHFYMGMRDIARLQASGLAARLGLRAGQRLLDLGGGPGAYGYTFAQETPGLKATVFDLPDSEASFREEGERYQTAEPVERINGSYADTPLGGPYDVVWVSQVLHGEGPEKCSQLVGKAAECLASGGVLWIQEFILDTPGGHPYPALFSLNMLVQTESGRSYTYEDISGFMTQAGLTNVSHEGPTVPGSPAGLVRGVKP